jgi:hypothetical protein
MTEYVSNSQCKHPRRIAPTGALASCCTGDARLRPQAPTDPAAARCRDYRNYVELCAEDLRGYRVEHAFRPPPDQSPHDATASERPAGDRATSPHYQSLGVCRHAGNAATTCRGGRGLTACRTRTTPCSNRRDPTFTDSESVKLLGRERLPAHIRARRFGTAPEACGCGSLFDRQLRNGASRPIVRPTHPCPLARGSSGGEGGRTASAVTVVRARLAREKIDSRH